MQIYIYIYIYGLTNIRAPPGVILKIRLSMEIIGILISGNRIGIFCPHPGHSARGDAGAALRGGPRRAGGERPGRASIPHGAPARSLLMLIPPNLTCLCPALFWDPSGQHAGHDFPCNPESEFLHGDPHFPSNPLLSTKGKRSCPFQSHHMPPFSSNPLLDTERSAAYMLRGAGGVQPHHYMVRAN